MYNQYIYSCRAYVVIFSYTVPTPRLVRDFPSVVTTFASLGLHEWLTDLHINGFEHSESTRAVHLRPPMSSLITESASMFTCLGRRPAQASSPLSRFPGTPMQSDPFFGIWSTVTFGAIVVLSCPSSLHVPGCCHYPGSWVGTRTAYRVPPILVSKYLYGIFHVAARPQRQFGLQVYGLQPGWLELSHRVDLMSKCPFAPTTEAAAWHTVATQLQTRRHSIFQIVIFQLGDPVFWVLSGIHRLSPHRYVTASQTVKIPRRMQWWGRVWFLRYLLSALCWVLSRAGVKGNRKLILVLIQERTRLLVSGRIESSAFSLFLSSCSFSLTFSLVLLPSFFLSLLQVLAFLPSVLPWDVTRSSGKCTQNKNRHIQLPCVLVLSWDLVRICIRANYLSLVRDLPSSNMLEAAISVSTL